VPPSQDALIENFEDGDHQLYPGTERDGWWSVTHDATSGGLIAPRPGNFVTEAGGPAPSTKAVHLTASGFTEWGASLNVSFYYKGEVSCAHNASAFSGVGFWAKGPGKVRVSVNAASVATGSDVPGGVTGGRCRYEPKVRFCWDVHGAVVQLSSEWQWYQFAWNELHQIGYGTGTLGDLDSSAIVGIAFGILVDPAFQPADFWIDDLKFVK
jgi:hypothetical protein